MDEGAVERALERIRGAAEGRPEPGAVDAALERARDQIEALSQTAAELEAALPERVGNAVQDGLREQVLPVARHLAEVRGLMAQLVRRLERIEGDQLAERHASVDDLALLVDLIASGWKNVDERLQALDERLLGLEGELKGFEERLKGSGEAIVYRIEDRRPPAAGSS
jgi:hypothetical protein